MRELFTTRDVGARGVSAKALRWGERTGRWRRICRGVYAVGPEEPSDLDRALATVIFTGGVASGSLAGVLHGLDAVALTGPEVSLPPGRSGRTTGVRRRAIPEAHVVQVGWIACTDGVQTLIELAVTLDDRRWEQALESALRKGLLSPADLMAALPNLSNSRSVSASRIRRVLSLRPAGAAPTESLLETLMVQLIRRVPTLPDPARQVEVVDQHGQFVARVDLAWPDLGLFVELDGQHHQGQPVYDSRRETAIVAATGWLCGRFTWTEVTRHKAATARRLAALAEQARRPIAS